MIRNLVVRVIATRIGSVRRVLCASPAYLEAHAPVPQRPQDLEAHECITFESLTSPAVWTFRQAKSELSVAIRTRLTVNTAEAAIDAAIAGLGVTQVLSYQVEAALQAGTLKLILDDLETEPSPVNLVHSGQGLLPLKTRAFIDFATERLRRKFKDV